MVCGQPLRKKCFQEAFTISEKLLVAYGSTEVGGASGGILSEEQLDEVQDFFCGPVADYLSLQVVDKDEKECAVGKVGTVMVKGKTLFSGYFNQLEEKDPATTGQFSEDGWFDTNDNGYFDHKGSLYVIDRNNDVISYGACLVYPGWLEQKILAHPKVRDVCLVPKTVVKGKLCLRLIIKKLLQFMFVDSRMGSTFERISLAAVGVSLMPPSMKERALFWTL
ncbi:4-coumarate--CoA ligase 1 [Aplysia californica]|uniref:4-coumarate--CoA ligase 1 n=1 Tax=Aplysia californica TaxID=6500 RepID=A0ABM0ZWE1_APLCA|nr:4-coumarate--CoA ligase 1 [Aplysia californica]